MSKEAAKTEGTTDTQSLGIFAECFRDVIIYGGGALGAVIAISYGVILSNQWICQHADQTQFLIDHVLPNHCR